MIGRKYQTIDKRYTVHIVDHFVPQSDRRFWRVTYIYNTSGVEYKNESLNKNGEYSTTGTPRSGFHLNIDLSRHHSDDLFNLED